MWHVDNSSAGLIVAAGGAGARVPLPDHRCAIANADDGVAEVVCDTLQQITVRRVRVARAEVDGADVTLPRRDVGNGGGLAVSADGNTVAYWGTVLARPDDSAHSPNRNRAVVLDLARGAETITYDQVERGDLVDVVPDPRGSGDVLLAIEDASGDRETLTIRRLTAGGKVVSARRSLGGASALYWTEPDRVWAAGACSADHLRLAP
jgi:hypothetical protein